MEEVNGRDKVEEGGGVLMGVEQKRRVEESVSSTGGQSTGARGGAALSERG